MSISSQPETKDGVLQLLGDCQHDIFVNTFGLTKGIAQILATYRSDPTCLFNDLVEIADRDTASEQEEVSTFFSAMEQVGSSLVFRVRLGRVALRHEMTRSQQMGDAIAAWCHAQ